MKCKLHTKPSAHAARLTDVQQSRRSGGRHDEVVRVEPRELRRGGHRHGGSHGTAGEGGQGGEPSRRLLLHQRVVNAVARRRGEGR